MNISDTFDTSQPYYQLNPDRVMDAIEKLGFFCDGRIMALNSYENRVYQVGIEDEQPIIAKFYRPERWSDEQIREEHEFTLELADAGIPAIAPVVKEGETLFHEEGFRIALFARRGGHAPELDNNEHLFELGRFLGHLHSVGELKKFQHRPALTVQDYGRHAQNCVLESGLLQGLETRYADLTNELLAEIDKRLQEFDSETIRVQGDCHCGNLLWRDGQLMMLDFDDCRMAPAMQDIWMLLSGDQQQQKLWLNEIVEGYEEFLSFPVRQLQLIEPLRSLRIIYYSGWLSERKDDPAFQQAFSHFGGGSWWQSHISNLEQQVQAISAPSLTLGYY